MAISTKERCKVGWGIGLAEGVRRLKFGIKWLGETTTSKEMETTEQRLKERGSKACCIWGKSFLGRRNQCRLPNTKQAWSILETARKRAGAAGSQCRRAEGGGRGRRGSPGDYCSISGKGRWIQLRCYFLVDFFRRGAFWMCPEHREFPLRAPVGCITYPLPVHLLAFSQSRDRGYLTYLTVGHLTVYSTLVRYSVNY